ncbi:MAG: hypothetical protein QW594_02550 [Candidatus Woesearchaeota archaeon]
MVNLGFTSFAIKYGLRRPTLDDAEYLVAQFIIGKFDKAKDLYLQERKKSFLEYLFHVWPEHDGIKNFYILDSFLMKKFPDLCGKQHPIQITELQIPGQYAHVEHDEDGMYREMWIGLEPIIHAKDLAAFHTAYHHLISVIYHECDHFYSRAYISEMQSFEEILQYYLDTAEIRAHAKQLAYYYVQKTPGVAFDYKYLKKLSLGTQHPQVSGLLATLELLRDPESSSPESCSLLNQQRYQYLHDLILKGRSKITKRAMTIAFSKYMHYLAYYVVEFNKATRPYQKLVRPSTLS